MLLLLLLLLIPACVSSAAPAPRNRVAAAPVALGVGPVTALGYDGGTVGGRMVTITETTLDGELVTPPRPSTDEIQQLVTKHLADLGACYPARATATTKVRLLLATDGTARAKVSSPTLPGVDACIAEAIGRWRTPVPLDEHGPRPRAYELELTKAM